MAVWILVVKSLQGFLSPTSHTSSSPPLHNTHTRTSTIIGDEGGHGSIHDGRIIIVHLRYDYDYGADDNDDVEGRHSVWPATQTTKDTHDHVHGRQTGHVHEKGGTD